MLGRHAMLPIDAILGSPSNTASLTQLDFSRQAATNLQLGCNVPRRNLTKCSDIQAVPDDKLRVPEYHLGEEVLEHRLYTHPC